MRVGAESLIQQSARARWGERTRVHEKVKGARLVEQREEGDRGGDLADDGLYLGHDLLRRLVDGGLSLYGLVSLHVKDPALERLPRARACDDDDELLHVTGVQPFCACGGGGCQEGGLW